MTARQAIEVLLRETNLEVRDDAGGLVVRRVMPQIESEINKEYHPAIYNQGASAESVLETVIVTGTRVHGMKAADSASPITVLDETALVRGNGSANLERALAQLIPSFNADSVGGDLGNLTLAAALRGVSPNDTLILINGKRRHGTSNIHADAGQYSGAAAADLSLIPTAAVDHIEVLLDGAAAQYGTDAIAGVINIILKERSSGGYFSASGGEYYSEGGATFDISGNMGFPLFDNGFINITAEKRYHDFTHNGGPDSRLITPSGAVIPTVYDARMLPNYPRTNLISGDAEYNLSQVALNAGYDVDDSIHVYSFGTYSHRFGKANQNNRLPDQVIASPVLGEKGCYALVGSPPPCALGTTPGELVFAPNGFYPSEGLLEDDYQYLFGAKFKVLGWDLDLSSTYGRNKADAYTLNSANGSLFVDTHTTPSNFYDGTFNAGQWTTTLDATRLYSVGAASPLTIAAGLEAREDTYQIIAGDAASHYKEGPQAMPGFSFSDASSHSRKDYAAYIDLALAPIENLQLDVGGRFEHYTDFGDARIAKLTARYDIAPALAVRGTISTGFRAPTLAEEYYSAAAQNPIRATVQLPPNSPAARLLGVAPLKPELSSQYSAGLVARPLDDLNITLDAYSIAIGDRIVRSGIVYGTGGAINAAVVTDAIKEHGNMLDPTVSQTAVALFINGISTRTQGLDLTANYFTDFAECGSVDWTLAGNINFTAITDVSSTPAPLVPATLFSPATLSNYSHSAPYAKAGLTANWLLDNWGITARETIYGKAFQLGTPSGSAPYYMEESRTVGIFDLEIRYNLTSNLQLAIGGNNIMNIRPETLPFTPNGGLVGTGIPINYNALSTAYGPNGGFYYGRIAFNF